MLQLINLPLESLSSPVEKGNFFLSSTYERSGGAKDSDTTFSNTCANVKHNYECYER